MPNERRFINIKVAIPAEFFKTLYADRQFADTVHTDEYSRVISLSLSLTIPLLYFPKKVLIKASSAFNQGTSKNSVRFLEVPDEYF